MVPRQIIGSWRDVSFEVAAWDGVGAQVDLSCGCMFTHEATADGPTGGLHHLDGAVAHFGNALAAART